MLRTPPSCIYMVLTGWLCHCTILTSSRQCRSARESCFRCHPPLCSMFQLPAPTASYHCTTLHEHHASWMHKDVQAELVSTGCTRPHCLCLPLKLHRQDVFMEASCTEVLLSEWKSLESVHLDINAVSVQAPTAVASRICM